MGWLRDETTGAEVWQDPESGKVKLRKKGGGVYSVTPAGVAGAILDGSFEPIEPEAVAQFQRERARTTGDHVATLAEGVASGALDALSAPVRAPVALGAAALGVEDPLADLTGRGFVEDVVALGGGETAAQDYAAGARARAQDLPGTALAGRVVGEIASPVSRLSLGAKTATGRVAATTAEGAALGGAQEGEDAYIANREVQRDRVLAGIGLGAMFAGGAAIGLEGASRVFSRSGSRGATAIDSPHGGPYRTKPSGVDEVIEHATGQAPAPGAGSKLLDAIDDIQSASTGAEAATLRRYGFTRWDDEAVAGRAMHRNRDEILAGAARDITAAVDDIAKRARYVTDEVVDSGLKRKNVRALLDGDEAEMIGAARAELASMRGALDEAVDNVGEYGNANFIKRSRKFIERLEREVATTDDAATAFIALDKAKRGIQKERVFLGRSAMRSQGADTQYLARKTGTLYEKIQEGGRQNLMNPNIWGEGAAGAQRKVNQAWEELFESNRFFERNFLTTTGESFDASRVMRADPKRVATYVESMGSAKGALIDEQFRAQVAAQRKLVSAIDEAYDLGAKRGEVLAVRDAADAIETTLGKADKTVKVANQIQDVMDKEGTGLGGAALLGGAIAGAPGALFGAAYTVATKPGTLIKSAAAIADLAEHVNRKMDGSVGRFFAKAKTGKVGGKLPKARKPRRLPRARRRVIAPASAAFVSEGETRREAYKKRVEEINEVAGNPGALAEKMATATEGVASAARFSGALTMSAQVAADFLASKVPRGSSMVSPLFPGGKEVAPTDAEIDELAAYWSTVMNPLGVLDDLENGMLTAQQVEALGAVYPSLLDDIRGKVTAQILELDEPLPFAARSQLELLLGLGGTGEPSLAPDFLATWAGAMSTEPEPARKPRPRPVDTKSPQKHLTLSEGLEL